MLTSRYSLELNLQIQSLIDKEAFLNGSSRDDVIFNIFKEYFENQGEVINIPEQPNELWKTCN